MGHSGGIMRTGPRSNTHRWRSRSDRSESGDPTGPSSVAADSHTAGLAGLESHLRTRGGCRLPAVRHGPVGGPLTRNLQQWQEAFGLGVCS